MKRVAVNRRGYLRFGFLLAILWTWVALLDPASDYYDLHIRDGATMFATVRLEAGDDRPSVIYSVLANQTITVHFSAWLEDAQGRRHCSGGEMWTYSKAKHVGSERDYELNTWLASPSPCVLPDAPFTACVDYTNTDPDPESVPYWGPFCSPPYKG